jgi:hypothetical protein
VVGAATNVPVVTVVVPTTALTSSMNVPPMGDTTVLAPPTPEPAALPPVFS